VFLGDAMKTATTHRANYARWLQAHMALERCFFDESGFNLGTFRGKGWAPKGQMALHIGPANNGSNHCIFLAVDAAAGVMLLEHKSGASDADTFVAAFQRLVEACIARGALVWRSYVTIAEWFAQRI
jgi:hypothetical protein